MKALFVDDHAMLRQSVAAQLRASMADIQVDEAGSLTEARSKLGGERFDLLITDLSLGDGDGLELLQDRAPPDDHVPCLILSMHADIDHIARALRSGAKGYVTKTSDAALLAEAARIVVSGGYYFDQVALGAIVKRLSAPRYTGGKQDFEAYGTLTEREQELFLLLAQGFQAAEIARRLSISPKTVENHRTSIYAKLGLEDRLALYHYAHELGLVS
jgi:DNA-binding NarL/FixJ family response regulator